ncbi:MULTISPECIES: T9SS type A sorting domain-containing protein [Aestuariivivens]|uniref:T9SS type A sorting domain-containing protein n=1 Tax=Aestuariivivens TaxID=1820275 RepID=UPI001F56004C|nr:MULTISPECIES: T9SS type A sorting domain-containing protein [Aestuariivivens]
MKTKLFLTAILMAFVGALNAQNLLLNGDFELLVSSNVFEDWQSTTWGEVRQQNPNTDPALDRSFDGTICVRLSAVNNYSELYQTVTVVPGVTYDITYSGRAQAGAANGTGNTGQVLYCEVIEDGGTTVAISNIATDVNTTLTTAYTVPAGITSITIKLYKNSGIAYFDNVSITESTLGIDDLKQFSFSSYPNPAQDRLYLSAKKNIDNIEVYNIVGKQVMNQVISNTTGQIDISKLADGLYIMKAYIEDAQGSFKFIKQ